MHAGRIKILQVKVGKWCVVGVFFFQGRLNENILKNTD